MTTTNNTTAEKPLSCSALLARIMILKQYNAATYQRAVTPINAYSRSLGKAISGYAETDAAVAGLLPGNVYRALQGDRQGQETGDQMPVRAVVYATVFPSPATGPQADVEADTARILKALAYMEDRTAEAFADAAKSPHADDIGTILHLGHAVGVAKNRALDLRSAAAAIENGTYWTRKASIAWICLQCGLRGNGATAFSKCPCCGAARAYASPA